MAKSKELEIAIKIAGKLDKSLNTALKAVGKGVVGVTKTLATASAATAAAVGAIGAASVNVGKEFEQAMSQVSATLMIDKTTKEGAAAFAQLEEAARKCGRETAFSATEAAEALNYLSMAGYDVNTATAALPTTLNLAGAGAMDLGAAADMLAGGMAALQLDKTEENFQHFSDILAITASKAKTDVAGMGEAISTVGGTAANLKGGVEEVAAALGILADNQMGGAEGGTHLRNLIMSLQNPRNKDAAAMFKDLGVSAYDAQGNMRGLNEIFGDLNKAMDGMTTQQRNGVLATLFKQTDQAAAIAMMENCGDRFNELYDAALNSSEGMGAAAEMYARQMDNLEGDISILKSGLADLGISIYQGLQAPMRETVQFATDLVGQLSEAFQSGGFEGLVGAVGDVLSQVIDKVAEYAPKAMEMGFKLLQALIDGIAENATAIGESAAEIATTFATGLSDMLPTIANAALDIITSFANALLEGDNLTKITEAAVGAISGFVQAILDHLPELIDAGGQIISQLITGILQGSDGSFADVATRVGILVFALQPLLGVFGGLSGIMGGITGVVGKIGGLFSNLGSAASAATAPLSGASAGLSALTANAKGLLALGAGFLMVAAGMALMSQAAIGIAQQGPGAAAAFVLLGAAVAGMAIGAAALAPALTAGAVGLVAFGAGVTLVGVGILAATAGIALLASQLPNIATYGASAAAGIAMISGALALLAAGCMAAAAGLTALFLPMVGGAASTAALGVALAGLSVAALGAVAGVLALAAAMLGLKVTMGSIATDAAKAGQSIANMTTGVDVISAGLNTIQEVASGALKMFASLFEREAPNAAAGATSMMNSINQALNAGWNTAKTQAQAAARSIKAAFENMTITIPKPRVPVISTTYRNETYGEGGSINIPEFHVNWNAAGGIFDQATILPTQAGLQGVGEAGPEAVLPLDTLWSQLREILDEKFKQYSGGGSIFDGLAEKLQGIGGGEPSTGGLELAGAGGPNVTYAPVYNLYGSAGKDEIAEADKLSQAEFNRMMAKYEKDNRRTRL